MGVLGCRLHALPGYIAEQVHGLLQVTEAQLGIHANQQVMSREMNV